MSTYKQWKFPPVVGQVSRATGAGRPLLTVGLGPTMTRAGCLEVNVGVHRYLAVLHHVQEIVREAREFYAPTRTHTKKRVPFKK